MRFCIFTTQETTGGGEVLMASIAEQLQLSGHTVGWVARSESQFAKALQEQQENILYLHQSRGRSWSDIRAVRNLIHDWAPDVLLMNDTHAVVLAGLASIAAKSVKPVRLAYKHTIFPLRSWLKYQLLTDRVVCVSQAARDIVIRGGVPASDTAVVYGGVAPPAVDSQARKRIRRELKLSEATTLLVCVGNLLDCKGHSDLLWAIQKLRIQSQVDGLANGDQVKLVIAGEGDQRSRLEAIIHECDLHRSVQLLGYRQDANQLLQAADLVVHPSRAEGLSLVLIQAQMLRVPVVATAVGGAAEVLGVEESECCTRWIAPQADATGLATQLQDALGTVRNPELRKQLQPKLDCLAERAIRKFSLRSNSLQLVDLAADLLHHRK